MRVGIAGFGKMGSAFAERLVATGMDVAIWNRNAERPRAAGFGVVETPRSLALGCDIVISSLFDAVALEAVYGGSDGLVAGAKGKLFIEMSTVLPGTQRALAARVAAADGAFVECPVSGTTGPAKLGQLVGLAAGEAADIDRARVVLSNLCRRIDHVGPIGNGALVKLAVNLPLIVFWQAFGEAMALLRSSGRDLGQLVELFSESAGGPNVLRVKAKAIVETLSGRDTVEPSFDIDSMRKDLSLIQQEATSQGFKARVAETVRDALDQVAREGWGERDCAWVPAFWTTRAE